MPFFNRWQVEWSWNCIMQLLIKYGILEGWLGKLLGLVLVGSGHGGFNLGHVFLFLLLECSGFMRWLQPLKIPQIHMPFPQLHCFQSTIFWVLAFPPLFLTFFVLGLEFQKPQILLANSLKVNTICISTLALLLHLQTNWYSYLCSYFVNVFQPLVIFPVVSALLILQNP